MRKRRGRSAYFGTVFLALLVALVLTGFGYAGWTDRIIIEGMVNTGTWGAELSDDVNCYTVPVSDNISCEPDGNVLGVAITSAHVGVHYYCEFVLNNPGTIPVKVQGIVVDPSPPASGVEVEVTDLTGGDLVGIQIDGGQAVAGKVHVYLSDDTSQGMDFDFTVTFSCVIWDQ